MPHGIELYDAEGHKYYDSTSVTWNQVENRIVRANESWSRTYPELGGREIMVLQMYLNPPGILDEATAHTLDVSGNTVTVSGGDQDELIVVLMR